MKKTFLFSLLVCLGIIAIGQNNIDVIHYKYHIDLNDKNDTLRGFAGISFVVLDDLKEIEFDLAGVNKSKGMRVDYVQFGLAAPGIEKYRQTNNKVIITSPRPYKKGDTAEINIAYSGIPDDGLIISKNKYGDRTFFADNWPNRAHHWLPCVDRPDDKASFEFEVIAPSHYRVIANGTKIREEVFQPGKKITHWIENIPLPTKVMVIGVAEFAVKVYEDSPPGIPVSAWVYKQDSIPGFRNYATAPSIVRFMSGYIGPYPYEKLANVQSKTIFGGMENASAIFYEELSASSDDNVDALMAHEIAHQWFGDMASEKSFPHLWLSEGFATYLTHLYLESRFGTDSLNNRMKADRQDIIDFARQSNKTVVDSTSQLMNLLNTNSYQKGSWVLHMLRRQVGDSVFQHIIRSYYAAYAGKNADTRDFQTICETETKKGWQQFFDQWLYSPGLPHLEVTWRYDAKNGTVNGAIKQLQEHLFSFPLEIGIRTVSGSMLTIKLNITTQNPQFSIPVREQPVQLILDPNTSLLFEGSARGNN